MGVFKLKFYIRRNLIRPRGMEMVQRSRAKIRHAVTFGQNSKLLGAKNRAEDAVISILKDTSASFEMKNIFRSFALNVIRLQNRIRFSLVVKHTRKQLIGRQFDKEKRIMAQYYFEKSKKQKKFKQMFASLQALDGTFRDQVLEIYYEQTIACKNLSDAILNQA